MSENVKNISEIAGHVEQVVSASAGKNVLNKDSNFMLSSMI